MKWLRDWVARSRLHTLCFYFIGIVTISYIGNHIADYVARYFGWSFRAKDTFLDALGFGVFYSVLMTVWASPKQPDISKDKPDTQKNI
jgi:uncharacterized membrane-anchored protein